MCCSQTEVLKTIFDPRFFGASKFIAIFLNRQNSADVASTSKKSRDIAKKMLNK